MVKIETLDKPQFVNMKGLTKCSVVVSTKGETNGFHYIKLHYGENGTDLIGPFPNMDAAEDAISKLN